MVPAVERSRGIQIFKCFFRFWPGAGFGKLDRRLHYLIGALVGLLADAFDLVAFLLEIELEARNRVAALPFDQFFVVAIQRRVVFAMPAIAVSLAFDQLGTFTTAHP